MSKTVILYWSWRFPRAEDGSRASQRSLNFRYKRVRAAEHAPCDPGRLFERRHCLPEIVERRAVSFVERHRVIRPQRKHESIISSENPVCHGYCFAHQ